MKIGYLILGCIFLCNPCVHIVDVLPDVFGYLFLLKGISCLADMNADLGDARRRFRSLCWISSLKFAMMLFAGLFDASMKLLLSFSFGVVELLYLLPAVEGLFTGIAYLEIRLTNHRLRYRPERAVKKGGVPDATRFPDGTEAFELYVGGRDDDPCLHAEEVSFADGSKTRVCLAERGYSSFDSHFSGYLLDSEGVRSFTVFFLIARTVCAVLPEMTSLFQSGGGYVEANPVYVASRARVPLLAVCVLAAAVFAVLWLFRVVPYFGALRRDRAFTEALSQKYKAEVVPNDLLWTTRRVRRFSSLCTAALVFFLSMPLSFQLGANYLDSFYLMPEFLFGVIALFAVRAAGAYAPRGRRTNALLCVFMAVSLLSYAGLFLYAWRFGGVIYAYRDAGYLPYYLGYLLPFALSMVFFVIFSFEKRAIYGNLAKKCVYFYADLGESTRREGIFVALRRRFSRQTALEILYALFSIGAMATLPYRGGSDLIGLAWAFRFVFSALLVVESIVVSTVLDAQLEKIV